MKIFQQNKSAQWSVGNDANMDECIAWMREEWGKFKVDIDKMNGELIDMINKTSVTGRELS